MYLVDNITSTNTAQIGVQSIFFSSLILSVCYSHKSDLWKDCKMSANYPKARHSWCFSKTVTQYWLWWTEGVFFGLIFQIKRNVCSFRKLGSLRTDYSVFPTMIIPVQRARPKTKESNTAKWGQSITSARLTHTAVAMHLQNGFKVLLVSLIDVTWNISRSFCFW